MKHKGTQPSSVHAPAGVRDNAALWGYGFGAALIGLGLLVLSIALGSALRSATRGVQRLALPGDQTLTLREGLYVGILPAAKTGAAGPGPADVSVVISDEGGAPVTQIPFPPELAQANNKIGTSLFQAQIPYDGRYMARARLAAGAAAYGAAPTEILLIHESLSRNPSDIIVGAILMVVLSGFGIYIIVLTAKRRRAVASAG